MSRIGSATLVKEGRRARFDRYSSGRGLRDGTEHPAKAAPPAEECRRRRRSEEGGFASPSHRGSQKRRLGALQGRVADGKGYPFPFFVRRNLRALLERARVRIERRGSLGYSALMNRLRKGSER
ncbi:hypothetical protein [Deferrisoma palaeochoriense]